VTGTFNSKCYNSYSVEQKTITADNDLWERADDALAEKRGVSRSELVRKAIREELQKAVEE